MKRLAFILACFAVCLSATLALAEQEAPPAPVVDVADTQPTLPLPPPPPERPKAVVAAKPKLLARPRAKVAPKATCPVCGPNCPCRPNSYTQPYHKNCGAMNCPNASPAPIVCGPGGCGPAGSPVSSPAATCGPGGCASGSCGAPSGYYSRRGFFGGGRFFRSRR